MEWREDGGNEVTDKVTVLALLGNGVVIRNLVQIVDCNNHADTEWIEGKGKFEGLNSNSELYNVAAWDLSEQIQENTKDSMKNPNRELY